MKIKGKPFPAFRWLDPLTLYWAGLDPQISKETSNNIIKVCKRKKASSLIYAREELSNVYLHIAQQLHLAYLLSARLEISQIKWNDERQSLPSTFAYVPTFGICTVVKREMPVSKISRQFQEQRLHGILHRLVTDALFRQPQLRIREKLLFSTQKFCAVALSFKWRDPAH